MNPFVRIGISVGVGFVLAVILDVAFFETEMSYVMGACIAILVELSWLTIAQEKTNRADDIIVALSDVAPSGDLFSCFISTCLITALKQDWIHLSHKAVTIHEPERIPQFWLTAIANVQTRLQVATYMSADSWWGKKYAEANVRLQIQKVTDGGIRISRVFIAKDSEEEKELAKIAAMQQEAGLIVGTITWERLESDPNLRSHIRKLSTPDVALIDERYAVIHKLDEHRQSKSLQIVWDEDRVQRVRDFLHLIEQEANPVTQAV